jgi:hypothetical protein
VNDRIPALLEPIQNRLNAATPGPWFREYSDVITSDPDPRDVEEGYDDPRSMRIVRAAPHLNKREPQGIKNADFIAAAPTDQARLLAAVQAVTALHKPVTLWMAHEDSDVSYQSKEDLLAERTDLTEADLVPFQLCSHCKMIENSPCEGECTMSAGYRESLWPCATVSAVEAALGGEA